MATLIDANGNYVPLGHHPDPADFGDGVNNEISYAGPPTFTPPDGPSIIVDVNGQQWMYWGGAWH
jgi:hypothetical protein